MKTFSCIMTTLVLGCLCAGTAWAADTTPPAAGASGNDPLDGALADALGGSTVAGASDAGSTTAPSGTTKTVSDEVVKYALARFDARVAAYDNALVTVDAADAHYRKYFNAYNVAIAAINAKIGGDRTNPMSYPDMQQLRDSSLQLAQASLKQLQADACAAANLYTALHQNPLFLYGYQETDYNKSRFDLGLFTKQMHWDSQVNPDLRYVQRRAAGSAAATTASDAAIPTEAALADQLKPAVVQDIDALVAEYDGLVHDAINASAQSKQAQTAYTTDQKKRPANTAPRTVRVRSGRGWVNRTLPNTALDNWNNQQRAEQDARASAEAQLQSDRQEAAARYAFLKQYPLLLSDNYKFVTDKNMPELPLLERK